MEKQVLTYTELAEYLGISERALMYRQANGQSMPRHINFGKSVRFRLKDVEAWLDELQEEQQEKNS